MIARAIFHVGVVPEETFTTGVELVIPVVRSETGAASALTGIQPQSPQNGPRSRTLYPIDPKHPPANLIPAVVPAVEPDGSPYPQNRKISPAHPNITTLKPIHIVIRPTR